MVPKQRGSRPVPWFLTHHNSTYNDDSFILIYRVNNSSGLTSSGGKDGLLDFTLASVEGNISGGILAASANSSIQPQVVLADK